MPLALPHAHCTAHWTILAGEGAIQEDLRGRSPTADLQHSIQPQYTPAKKLYHSSCPVNSQWPPSGFLRQAGTSPLNIVLELVLCPCAGQLQESQRGRWRDLRAWGIRWVPVKGQERAKVGEQTESLKKALLDKFLQAPPLSQAPYRRWRERESTSHQNNPRALKKLATELSGKEMLPDNPRGQACSTSE